VVFTFLQEPSIFITNVQVRQEDFEVIITYDMAGELQGKAGVMVGYSTDGGRNYKTISHADGDLGKYVLAGTGREITLLTNDTFAGKNASFEVFVSSSPPGSPWNFTNAGATGRFGPTQAQVNTTYAGSSLEGEVTITTQGIQEWTVPATGTYIIEVWGAQGGTQPEFKYGGRGARMKGNFLLDGGDTLQIAVGQSGLSASSSDGDGGGGGGTFVAKGTSISSASPLIIAGGGGGDGSDSKGGDATSKWSTLSNSNTGNGGNNSGGGGFYSSASSYGGQGFIQGAVGGDGWYDGGFGGGGGSQDETASGGGGYTGGYAFDGSSTGGAGSYNYGTNQSNSSGSNTGHGKVVITYVQGASEPTIAVSGVSNSIKINGVRGVAQERSPELFLPRDEFETSAEYSQRVAQKEALIKDLRAQILVEQKALKKERVRLAAERAAVEEQLLQIKIAESLAPVEFTPSGLGRYDADEGTFPLTVNGQTYTVAIPRSEARDFKANYTSAKVEGYKQLQRDLKTYDYFDLVIIHPITGSRFPLAVEEVVTPINYKELVEKHDGFYTRDGNEPYSGPVFDLFENGNKKLNGTFKEGIMIGEWVFYWPEGNQILAKGQYVNGDGKGFDPEHEYEISWIPKNGREGVWEYYYQNGNQWFEKTYEDGIPMGEYLEWWNNGEKAEEGVFKGVNNWGFPEKVGKWTYWYETGQKWYEKTY
jgi:antitoxin component YwqK of YwqJK toxin-antitoxin module